MISGRYQDTVTCASGIPREQPWRSNLIVDGCYQLVAALMKREPGSSGVLWWAISAGEASWDASPPRASVSDQRLLGAELQRQEVLPEHMRFVDAAGTGQAAPSRRLEVRGAIRSERIGGAALREFALFGGNASREPHSGTLINHVIHPRVDLQPGELLERRLILSFGEQPVSAAQRVLGRDLPARRIKGVDDVYARVLEAAGITTVYDLGGLHFDEPLAAIPPTRFREFVDKARAVSSFHALASLLPFAALSVLEVLELSAAELARRSGGALDEEAARDAQRSLGILQVSLDATLLRTLSISALVPD